MHLGHISLLFGIKGQEYGSSLLPRLLPSGAGLGEGLKSSKRIASTCEFEFSMSKRTMLPFFTFG